MNDLTRILYADEQGEAGVPEQLLPLVYDELRRLAAARLASEALGQTLVETASQPSGRELALFQSEASHLLGIADPKLPSRG